jgi:predicted AAA+ superfamily ATPase
MREQGEGFDLDRALRLGSLPLAVTSSEEDARDFLGSYAQTYLREEVQAEALVRNLGGFARFLDVAAAQCGDLLNCSAVGRDASLATRTVQEYFGILEDTLIGVRLEAWRRSVRSRLVAHPRFYLFDTGVTNALNRRLAAPPDPVARGRLFEQWIVLECTRLLDYAKSEARLFFWRTNHGAEVDLLVERHGKLRLAAEVKAKRRIVGADLTGLRAFAAENPGVPRVVVSLVPEEHRLENVGILPYRSFLDRLETWL